MLTIGRKPGEYIVIGEDIIITADYEDGMMRISIDAPKEMKIRRGEVWEQERPRPACLDAELRRGKKRLAAQRSAK